MSTYQSKINSKLWQDKSHRVKTRDNLKCQAFDCSTPNSILQVHHIDYIFGVEPWDYPEDMLITLCQDCHAKEKSRYKLENLLFTALKMSGFLASDIVALTTTLYDSKFSNHLLTIIRKYQNG